MKSSLKPLILSATTVSLILAACATPVRHNDMLEQARSTVTRAERNPYVAGEARTDLTTAQQALSRGDALLKAGKPVADVDHQAYLAQRFALAAEKGADLSVSEKAIADAGNRRNAVLLSARETDAARATELAQRKSAEAAVARSDAAVARSDAQVARSDAEVARSDAQDSARLADVSARDNEAAQQRARELESALADLKATKTDRGLVITLGDVLFASGRSDLKSGSLRSLDKLSAFLRQYPARNVRIEGFTDSIGTEDFNQDLSERRAGAVRDALTGMGVAHDRVQVRGYGKGSPVAGNDTATGRQQNRRVEVIILDDAPSAAATR